jgi:hypothetical protein
VVRPPEAGEEPLRLLLLVKSVAVHLKLEAPPPPCDDVVLACSAAHVSTYFSLFFLTEHY